MGNGTPLPVGAAHVQGGSLAHATPGSRRRTVRSSGGFAFPLLRAHSRSTFATFAICLARPVRVVPSEACDRKVIEAFFGVA
jgi:hypothetical protein